MANNITLAEKYINDPDNFNGIYKRESLTSLLETERIRFLDANTVKVPNRKFSTGTIGDYSRANGGQEVGLEETWDTFTIAQDKGEFMYLDVMDDEETLSDGLIARANRRYSEDIVPYLDTYRFGKLQTVPTASVVGAKIITSAAATPTNAIELVDDAHTYLQNNEVPIEGTILYVSPDFKKKMQRSPDITRTFGTREITVGGVNTQFDVYNGSLVITVPAPRLGLTTEFILVNPKSITSTMKFNESRLVNATETTKNLFGFYWKWRMYHDLFISKGQAIKEGSVLVNPGIYVKKIGA